MTDDLRERLGSFGAWTLEIFAEYLTSDDTVERVARALCAADRSSVLGWEDEDGREMYERQARAGLAALAAALAPGKEAS